jgi:hypothetical protein
MKNKDLIKKLQEFDGELDVSITDGYDVLCYTTENIDVKVFQDGDQTTLDIGIGGNRI